MQFFINSFASEQIRLIRRICPKGILFFERKWVFRLVMEVILFICWFCKYCGVESSVLYVDSGVKKVY